MLAKGSDEKLKSLAEQELKAPTDADEQVKLADAWWDLAPKEVGIARDSLHLHAGDFYRLAIPNLNSALKKAVIEKRLAEIADLKPASTAAETGQGKSTGEVKFPLHQWVDVLRLIDPTHDRVNGAWTRNGAELSCKSGFASRVEVPVVIDGGYDFGVEFTRTSGNDLVAATLSVGSHKCIAGLSGWNGSVSGLMNVNGGEAIDPKNPIVIKPGSLEKRPPLPAFGPRSDSGKTAEQVLTYRSTASPTCRIGKETPPP